MPISWTDPAPTDGTTVLTSARWEQIKTDLEAVLAANGIDSAMLADGIVTRMKLGAGNRDVIQALPIPMIDEVQATSRTGFQQTNTSAKEFWGTLAPVDGTIIAVDFVADEVLNNACTCDIAIAGVATLAAPSTLAVQNSPQIQQQTGLAHAVTAGQRIGVLVQGVVGATDVLGGFATIWYQRTLA